jgi:protein phosphatase
MDTHQPPSHSSRSHHPNRRDEHGPFDIIGDVHGCLGELTALLEQLGWKIDGQQAEPPDGRKAVFVGDLVDRGPDSVGVLKLVMSMTAAGIALCVPGNHDAKLLRKLHGRNVQAKHGLSETLAQLAAEPPEFSGQVRAYLESLPNHLILDNRRLVVAHAGIREDLIGRMDNTARDFALYGDTTGKSDEYGLPVRLNWAAKYRGKALIVFGHTPVPQPLWLNNTVNIDTGCVFGGALTALCYPERELVSVPAQYTYAVSIRPIEFEHQAPPQPGAPDEH